MHMYLLETFKIVNNNYFTLKSPSVGLSNILDGEQRRSAVV